MEASLIYETLNYTVGKDLVFNKFENRLCLQNNNSVIMLAPIYIYIYIFSHNTQVYTWDTKKKKKKKTRELGKKLL